MSASLDLFSSKNFYTDRLTILGLNVQSASTERAQKIVDYLDAGDSNIIFLSELSSGSGSKLILNRLQSIGYTLICEQPKEKEYSSAILIGGLKHCLVELQRRVLRTRIAVCQVRLGARELALCSLYFPTLNSKNLDTRREAIDELDALLQQIKAAGNGIILGGDINSIDRNHTPMIREFAEEGFPFHTLMAKHGLKSMATQFGKDNQYTWFDYLRQGQCLDNFFVSTEFAGLVTTFNVLKDTGGISDHFAIKMEMRI